MRNYTGTCKEICSDNLVYNFFPLQSSVFVVHFPIAFLHANKEFPEGRS